MSEDEKNKEQLPPDLPPPQPQQVNPPKFNPPKPSAPSLSGGKGDSSGGPSNPCVEITPPAARRAGHRLFKSKSGHKVRYDEKDNHWHVENPNKTGDSNKYLDKFGNPTYKKDPNAHMKPDDLANLLEQLGGSSC